MWHLNANGDPGRCKAMKGNCPFGQHFEALSDAAAAFEKAATFERQELTEDEQSFHSDTFDDLIMFNEAIEGNYPLVVNGESQPHLDAFRYPELARGNSKALADYTHDFTDDDSFREDGYQTYAVVDHTPVGSLVGQHFANTVEFNGETYVIDFGFAEIDPNAQWPYVGKVDQWKAEVDKASVLGAPEKEPDPIDPRSLTVPIYPAGEPNPLLEKAVMEEATTHYLNKTQTRFLSVDQVRVAAVHYMVETDGAPHLYSIETRKEYRNQGYMKKLLADLAAHHGVDQVYSSGSMTNDGYTFTSHLTKPRDGVKPKVNWPDYGEAGAGTFGFVHDWVTGVTKS